MTINSIDFFGIGRKSKIVKSQFGINNSKGIKSNYNFMGGKPINKIDPRFIGNPLSLAPKQQKFSKIHQSYWGDSKVPIWMQENNDGRLGGTKKSLNQFQYKDNRKKPKEQKPKEQKPREQKPREQKSETTNVKRKVQSRTKTLNEQLLPARIYENLKQRNKKIKQYIVTRRVNEGIREYATPNKNKSKTQQLIDTIDTFDASQLTKQEKKDEKEKIAIERMKANEKRKRLKEKEIRTSKERSRLKRLGIGGMFKEMGIDDTTKGEDEKLEELIYSVDTGELTKQEEKEEKVRKEREKKKQQKDLAAKEKTKKLIELYGKSKGFRDVLKSDKVFEAEVARTISEEKGKPLKTKYIKVLAEAEKRNILKHPIAGTYQRGKETLKAAPKAFREAYGKEERAATRKVQKLVKAGLGGIFGASIMQQKFGPAIKGRPGGPSGRYMIEGKPVYEEEFQKYAAEQRAKNRIMPSQNQQAPLTAEQQIQMYSDQTIDTSQNLPSTSRPMTPGEIQATKQMIVPQRGYSSEEVKMAQELAQQQDNILNAPSFMKGELKATGGSLLTSTGPQIMDAPNAFKGQLRTLNRGEQVASVKIGDRPQTNPNGDEYIDIELGSGKPVLKKRISEAWMDGRAL